MPSFRTFIDRKWSVYYVGAIRVCEKISLQTGAKNSFFPNEIILNASTRFRRRSRRMQAAELPGPSVPRLYSSLCERPLNPPRAIGRLLKTSRLNSVIGNFPLNWFRESKPAGGLSGTPTRPASAGWKRRAPISRRSPVIPRG